jgi:hypothetical protein
MAEIKVIQESVAIASTRNSKETKKFERDEKRTRAAQEARDAPSTEPQATARQLNTVDISKGKMIQRAKP